MTDFEILSLVIGIIGLVLTAMLVAYGKKTTVIELTPHDDGNT